MSIRLKRWLLHRQTVFGLFLAGLAMLLTAASLAADRPAPSTEPLAVFHVGNSLTDQAYGMHDIAKARGHATIFGRHMIPGAPLEWLWNHRDEGFREPDSKKPADEILRGRKWDVLVLQPFGSPVEKSVEFGAKYAAAAYEGNPQCQVYVFANYPVIGKDGSEKGQWESRWLSPDYTRGKANFEQVARGLSAKFPDKKPVRIIPVGQVMYRLHLLMKSGKVPGCQHIADLYSDGVHLEAEGKYLEAVTHYATIFGDDPHGCITSGLRFWKGPYGVEAAFAKTVWDVAWEVITTDPLTGVAPAPPNQRHVGSGIGFLLHPFFVCWRGPMEVSVQPA